MFSKSTTDADHVRTLAAAYRFAMSDRTATLSTDLNSQGALAALKALTATYGAIIDAAVPCILRMATARAAHEVARKCGVPSTVLTKLSSEAQAAADALIELPWEGEWKPFNAPEVIWTYIELSAAAAGTELFEPPPL